MTNLKIRAAALLVLAAAAGYTASEAMQTLRPRSRDELPAQVYAALASDAEEAEYFLKNCGGYVAVYEDAKYKDPPSLTPIETAILRSADRAMLDRGIPIRGQRELLALLEDLGS